MRKLIKLMKRNNMDFNDTLDKVSQFVEQSDSDSGRSWGKTYSSLEAVWENEVIFRVVQYSGGGEFKSALLSLKWTHLDDLLSVKLDA